MTTMSSSDNYRSRYLPEEVESTIKSHAPVGIGDSDSHIAVAAIASARSPMQGACGGDVTGGDEASDSADVIAKLPRDVKELKSKPIHAKQIGRRATKSPAHTMINSAGK